MTDREFKPCPFCGSQTRREFSIDGRALIVHDCTVVSPIACSAFTFREALANWNQRAALAQPEPKPEAWLPISTAPKDETEVLLKSAKGRIANGLWVPVNGSLGYWAWPYVNVEPVEWLPLSVITAAPAPQGEPVALSSDANQTLLIPVNDDGYIGLHQFVEMRDGGWKFCHEGLHFSIGTFSSDLNPLEASAEVDLIVHVIELAVASLAQKIPAGEAVSHQAIYETIIKWDIAGKRSRRELTRRIEALYTHPQRELTDEEIDAIALSGWNSQAGSLTQALRTFARAILAARKA